MKRRIVTNITILKTASAVILNNTQEEKNHIQNIIKDLEDSLDMDGGLGLSAIQIGIVEKVAIIRLPNCKLNLVNPKIIKKEKRFRFEKEGCLSLPGLLVDTGRYMHITIENENKLYSLEGLEAVTVQHEINHIEGKLIIDKGIKWQKRK